MNPLSSFSGTISAAVFKQLVERELKKINKSGAWLDLPVVNQDCLFGFRAACHLGPKRLLTRAVFFFPLPPAA